MRERPERVTGEGVEPTRADNESADLPLVEPVFCEITIYMFGDFIIFSLDEQKCEAVQDMSCG